MATDEDVIGNVAAAAAVGVQPSTWRAYVKRGQGLQPYRREIDGGHALPVWRRSALDEWLRTRPGRGHRRTGQSADADQGVEVSRSAP